MTETPLRVGLAGCGGIARQYHLRELLADPRVELVAIADPDQHSRAALSPLPGVEILESAEDLIGRPGIEAIVVCAPTPLHARIAAAVSNGDQHLYLEKPVALTMDEAHSLERALEARPQVCAIGFNFRRSPALRRLRDRLEAEGVGEVLCVRGWQCEAAAAETMPEWKRARRSGGGAMLEIASHQVDFARWLLGREVADVEEARLDSIHSEHDDARFVLTMEGGARVEIVVSYVQGRKHRWEVEGSRGVLRAERWPARVSRPRRGSQRGPTRVATSLRALPIPRREPSFGLALRDFAAACHGEARELPTIADGRRSLEVVLAAERLALGQEPPVA